LYLQTRFVTLVESSRSRRAAANEGKFGLNACMNDVAAVFAAVGGEMRAGRLLEAQTYCRQALEASPEEPELLHLMALVYLHLAQFDHVVEWVSRAIKKDPKPSYLTTLGTALQRSGRLDEALKALDKAVQLKPDDAELWLHLGSVLVEAGRLSDALLCFEHTLTLNPRHGEAALQAGHILNGLERFEDALAYLDRSAQLRPDHALTLSIRGLVLKNLNRLEEALVDHQRAFELDPTPNADVYNNMGTILEALGQTGEALAWYDRSLGIRPDVPRTLTNKAMVLTELRRFDEAIAAYDRAVAVDASYVEAAWNLALLHMLRGNFEAGWRGREVRWRIPALAQGYPTSWGPMWLGRESVAGKTVVVRQNEGLGDAIQFSRYIPMLASRGAHVILVADESLRPLLSKLNGVSQCLPKLPNTVVPTFDFHIAIDSLPLAFRTMLDSVPAEKAYFPAPDADRVQAWETRLGARERLRVGLVWSGNPDHTNDRRRSMPLQMMSHILDVDAMFVSLQKEPRAQDAAILRKTEIVDHSRDLTDFAETAALVSCLDLVITVDTSVAHLAAALGRPTWILLPYNPDFRWLLDRDDSPWYPTAKLFRQTENRRWPEVLDRLRVELGALVEDWRSARA